MEAKTQWQMQSLYVQTATENFTTVGKAPSPSIDWIPAFAGMTGVTAN